MRECSKIEFIFNRTYQLNEWVENNFETKRYLIKYPPKRNCKINKQPTHLYIYVSIADKLLQIQTYVNKQCDWMNEHKMFKVDQFIRTENV